MHPEKAAAGVAGHEIGHWGLRTLFTKDAMLQKEYVDGVIHIAKTIKVISTKTGKEVSLYQSFIENNAAGIKEGDAAWKRKKLNEEELFWHVAEFLSKDGNIELAVKETKNIKATDWSLACDLWLQRRKETKESHEDIEAVL